jgi:hypothetical protein
VRKNLDYSFGDSEIHIPPDKQTLKPPRAKALTLTHKSGRMEQSGKMNALQGIHDPHPSFP